MNLAITPGTGQRSGAIVCHKFGPVTDLQIEEIDTPAPRAGQLRIRTGSPDHRLYLTSDNRAVALAIAPHEHQFWQALCIALGLRELAGLSGEDRVSRREASEVALTRRFAELTFEEVRTLLGQANVCCAPVLRADEVSSLAPKERRAVPGQPTAPIPAGRILERAARGAASALDAYRDDHMAFLADADEASTET